MECLRSCILTSGNPAAILALFHALCIWTNGFRVSGLGTTYGQPSHLGSCSRIFKAAIGIGIWRLPVFDVGKYQILFCKFKCSHLASSSSRFLQPRNSNRGTIYFNWVFLLVSIAFYSLEYSSHERNLSLAFSEKSLIPATGLVSRVTPQDIALLYTNRNSLTALLAMPGAYPRKQT